MNNKPLLGGVVAAVVVILLFAGCGGSAAPITAKAPEINPLEVGNPEQGREIFENGTKIIKESCARCHSLDGTVSTKSSITKSPSLQGISERAGDRVPELSAVDYLRQSIVDPSAYIVEGYEDAMDKGYKYGLSEEEVNDLVAFLLTQ